MVGFYSGVDITVSKVLNHASDTSNAESVTSFYDRNEYLPDKRRALDAWAMGLLKIAEDRKLADNVVRFICCPIRQANPIRSC